MACRSFPLPTIRHHHFDGAADAQVLLSFAQFERELAGERIRDKFAASRRKGMWMGGANATMLSGWWSRCCAGSCPGPSCRCEPAWFVLMRSRMDSAGLRWTEMMRMGMFVIRGRFPRFSKASAT
jgi:hypothetical protein